MAAAALMTALILYAYSQGIFSSRKIARACVQRVDFMAVPVEPVLGQIKSVLGFTRFLLRGLDKVRYEWGLVCLASNLRKLAAAS